MKRIQRRFRAAIGMTAILSMLLFGACSMGGGGDQSGTIPAGYTSPFQNTTEADPAYDVSSAGVHRFPHHDFKASRNASASMIFKSFCLRKSSMFLVIRYGMPWILQAK